MKKYKFYAVLCPIFMILEVLGDIYIPYLMSRIVDVGIENRDIDYIVRVGLIMVGAALLAMAFGVISAHFGARAGFGFASEIRKEAFKKVQGFSFANLDRFTVSSLITRLTNDCNTLGQVTMMSLRMAVRAPFLMLFALIMAFSINRSLARVFMVAVPLTAATI
ncbi:MAG: ABC transporter transmembrane domain-containing protein, partial [Tepidanaerobacteraceae bacterium]